MSTWTAKDVGTSNLDPWALLDEFERGYMAGYLAGIDRGRELADAEAAALHHQAWRVVQSAAKHPSHADRERQRRAGLLESYRTDNERLREQLRRLTTQGAAA